MRRVYLWMRAGLLVTAACAADATRLPQFRAAVFGNYRTVTLFIIAHFALAVVLTTAIHRLTGLEAAGCFALYAGLTGVLLSSVFLRHPLGDIACASSRRPACSPPCPSTAPRPGATSATGEASSSWASPACSPLLSSTSSCTARA
ncbi:MAG: hypothetical protein K6E40_00500 [Desulfovibrio sp.]|nr:hypothetical protein [Desulfovibrio sp.]